MRTHMIRKLSILLISISISGTAFAGPKKIVTLDEALELSLASSEDLKTLENAVKAGDSALNQSRAALRPYLGASFSLARNFMRSDYYSLLLEDYSMEAGLTLSQKLFDFGKTRDGIEIAKKQRDISRLGAEQARREVVYATKSVYYRIHLAKMIYFSYKESLERAQAIRKIVEERSRLGRASKYDNIKSLADISYRKPLVNGAMADMVTVVHALATLLNFPVEIIGNDLSSLQIDISSDIFRSEYRPLDHTALAKEMISSHPSLSGIGLGIESARLREHMLKKYYYPDFSAFASVTKSGNDDTPFVAAENLNTLGVMGVRVSLPLFDSGVRAENIKQAEYSSENARLALDKKRKELILALESAVARYNEHIKILEANKKALSLMEESFRMSQDMFRSGYLSISDLNDAELGLTSQKINLMATYVAIEDLRAQIEKLTGEDHE